MSTLGEFLEAVYGPTDRYRTVRAVARLWWDLSTTERALANATVAGRRKASAAPPGAAARIWEEDSRIWVDGPARVRIEETRRRDGLTESSLVVVDGERWWNRDSQGHVSTHEPGGNNRHGGPGLMKAERHFFPASLREFFVGLALESLGPVRTARRECVRVRAVPRPGRLWPHWLPTGADEYELHADPERAVVLFIAAKFQGQVFETDEVVEVAFDEPLGSELFTYDPRPGEQVRPAQPIIERLTLAGAVARMPFTVLVPTQLPDPDHTDFEVMYHPPRLNGARPHLMLMHRGSVSLWLNLSETPAAREALEWETVERNGRRIEISDPGPGERKRVVRLEHLGTHVDMWSDLDRDRLLDVAASLAPALPAAGG